MYGIHFTEKLDARHLLLDYNFFQFPMLSTFPVGGYQEIIYNFTKRFLEYIILGHWDGKRAMAKIT
jgi:NADH:ubiquinone oxidoreductase subunit C